MRQLLLVLQQHPACHALYAMLAGAVSIYAYAPYHVWWLAAVALWVPLWLSHQRKIKPFLIIWLCFGFGKMMCGGYWLRISMINYGDLSLGFATFLLILFSLYLSVFALLAGGLLYICNPKHKITTTAWVFPAIWCLCAWLRGEVLTGFPWIWDGYALTDTLFFPLAGILGALGLTLFSAFLTTSLWLLMHRHFRPLALQMSLLSAVVLFSYLYQPIHLTGQQIIATTVQANIPQDIKWSPASVQREMNIYSQLSRPHWQTSDLIIWSEAAISAPEHRLQLFLRQVDIEGRHHQTAILTGLLERSDQQSYNALIVLGQYEMNPNPAYTYMTHKNNRYRKNHLLPFGEFVPLREQLKKLGTFFNLPMSNFARGAYQQASLQAKGYKILPAICYEIAFAQQLKDNFKEDISFILTLSNDTWFGQSIGPHQHLQTAQMRAAELGRPLVRSTNNGISAFIDADGQITKRSPQFEATTMTHTISPTTGRTLFSYYGQTPFWISSLLMIIAACYVNRRQPSDAANSNTSAYIS
ncbi:MAG: apolipoprotein N-acyltransferase [Shewanellaceae bacterium]|nr:apolipoprotein N-acyltransferase [Shewanellaceae bacterium]